LSPLAAVLIRRIRENLRFLLAGGVYERDRKENRSRGQYRYYCRSGYDRRRVNSEVLHSFEDQRVSCRSYRNKDIHTQYRLVKEQAVVGVSLTNRMPLLLGKRSVLSAIGF
jgi:hypothetical protein